MRVRRSDLCVLSLCLAASSRSADVTVAANRMRPRCPRKPPVVREGQVRAARRDRVRDRRKSRRSWSS